MARFSSIRNSFLAGEVSPKIWGRTDYQQFPHACKQLTNYIVLPEGGARVRQGTFYSRQPIHGAVAVKLIPFTYAIGESYLVHLCVAGGVNQLDIVNCSSGTVATLTTFGTPALYTASEWDDIQYTQSADVLYLVHPSHPPLLISRTATNAFQINEYDYFDGEATRTERQAYRDVNTTGITLTPSNTSGTGRTITASSALFSATHVGSIWKLTQGATTGSFKITAFTSTTVVTVDILSNFSATTATVDWEEPAWSGYRGYPRTICFHESRLCYGGNASQPDTMWASKASNYAFMMATKFAQDATADSADDPIAVTIASQQVNAIQWMTSGENLTIGTLGAEYQAKPIDPSTGFAPRNLSIKPNTDYGSVHIAAKRVGNTTIFVTRDGSHLREISFDLTEDTFIADDLSILGNHMPGKASGVLGTIKQMEYQACNRVLWCRDSDGSFFGLTRDKRLGIMAWHWHEFGGSYTGGYSARVVSFAIVPSPDGTHDDIWFCMLRTISGADSYTIEVMRKDFGQNALTTWNNTTLFPPCYMDCATALTGSNLTSWAVPLSFQTAGVIADGIYLGTQAVSASHVTTPAASQMIAGLIYTPVLEPLFTEAGAVTGSAQIATKRIEKVMARLYRSCTLRVENSEGVGEDVEFQDETDTPIELFTGDKFVDHSGDWETEGTCVVSTTVPLPQTIVSLSLRGVTDEF